jgi:hypothetical protein
VVKQLPQLQQLLLLMFQEMILWGRKEGAGGSNFWNAQNQNNRLSLSFTFPCTSSPPAVSLLHPMLCPQELFKTILCAKLTLQYQYSPSPLQQHPGSPVHHEHGTTQ